MTEKEQLAPAIEAFLDRYDDLAPDWAREYLRIHRLRFQLTLEAIPQAAGPDSRAIELGTYGLFPLAMVELFGYGRADGTTWENSPHKIFQRTLDFDPEQRPFTMYDLNLEQEMLPVGDKTYDMAVCAEVIEHMPVDPMALLWELNRILKVGGVALITTPNVTSAVNVRRILNGDVPNSYYQYRKARSADRHNLEYSPALLRRAVEAAGFTVDRLWTYDCWNAPDPDMTQTISDLGFATDLRGDNMFLLATKASEPVERFPAELYD